MPEDDELPRLLSGRYRLEGTLGQGGMGVVYRGTDLTMKRPVAVKLVRAEGGLELDDEIAGRFLREAKNTARLQHENIIEVFDLGRTPEGGLYFVMELLEGESLSSRLRKRGRLSAAETVHIARQICDGLEVAHSAGVIHRDLKPANIMLLVRAGVQDYVKVLDFGVAKALGSIDQQTQLTHTGMLVGTVDYMAPEQITGKPIDGRTDIYSLGVLLYRMLAGQPAFRDTGVPALIHAHLNTMPKPLIEVTNDVPNELDRVVLRCMAKNPVRRYDSMAELGRALVAALQPHSFSTMKRAPAIPAILANPPVFRDSVSPKPPAKPPAKLAARAPVPPAAAKTSRSERRGKSGLADVSFDETDPYASDAQTRIADRSAPEDDGDEDATLMARKLPKEDATLMMDRAPAPQPRQGAVLPPPQRPAPVAHHQQTQQLGQPRPCAMCQTVNPIHVLACKACGVGLAPNEQDAVRARVRASMPVPPPHGPMYAQGQPRQPQQSFYPPPPGPHAPQWPAPPPATVWQRFLTWTGLRPR